MNLVMENEKLRSKLQVKIKFKTTSTSMNS